MFALALAQRVKADIALRHRRWMAKAMDNGLARFVGTVVDPPKTMSIGKHDKLCVYVCKKLTAPSGNHQA